MLASYARTGEPHQAPMSSQRGVRRRQAVRYRSRGLRDERRVEGRIFLEHVADLLRGKHVRFRALHGARAGAMRRVVEQDALAERLTRAKRHEANRASVLMLLDRHRAGLEYRHEFARRALVKQYIVALERLRRDKLGELVQRRVCDALEKLRPAKTV